MSLTDMAQQSSCNSEKGEPINVNKSNDVTKKKYNVVVIDKVFRYLVPMTYAIFCIVYFVYFTNYAVEVE